jgi:hypothetical protein
LGGIEFVISDGATKKLKEREELEKAEMLKRELKRLRDEARGGGLE